LASTLKACGLAAAELKYALEAVDRRVKSFAEAGSIDAAGKIIERVELKRDGMQIALNLRALLPAETISEDGASLRMTRMVPMQMKRRGIETRLVIPGEDVAVPRRDPALLRALARGYQWFGELASGRAASTKQIAVSVIAMCVTWSHSGFSPPKSWKRSARDNNPLLFRRNA
jgi:hypothetical protein